MKLLLYIGLVSLALILLFFIYKKSNMNTTKNNLIDNLLLLRDLSLKEVKQKFHMTKEHQMDDLKYEKLDSLTKLYNPNTHPGHFYFKNNKLKMLYINAENLETPLLFDSLKIKLEDGGVQLKSRAGKFPHFVYPQKGLAFSVKGNDIVFIEVFPPTSIEDYLSKIYIEPPVFRK